MSVDSVGILMRN